MLIIGIFATVALAFFGVAYSLLGYNMRLRNRFIERISQAATDAGKKDESLLKGRRLYIEREDLRSVRLNLYQPDKEEKLPVIFVAHGGKFNDHDADDIDDFCDYIARNWQVNVVSISYTKIKAHITSYAQDEIRDMILYFREHAGEYNLDMKNFLLMGFEAGAYLSLIAHRSALLLGVVPSGIIMIDPFIDYVPISFAQAGLHPGPVALVLSGKDTVLADRYEYELREADVYVRVKRIPFSSAEILLREDVAGEVSIRDRENVMRWLKETVDLYLRR